MRNEELLNKAKEQQCEVKGVVDQFSEWEEWEPSEEQVAYEEEHCDDDYYEWLVDENEICFDIYKLSWKINYFLELYISNEKSGEHQAKRGFKDCVRSIRSIRKNVNEVLEDKEKYLKILDKLETISRAYM